jgi:hypothetical protein
VPICRTRLTFFFAREDCVTRGLLGLSLETPRRTDAPDRASPSPGAA